ncbi:MAG: DUF2249 domain-containing protein [Microlunatus sp.]|nr:DUF2249 domain-containing protein [Microlunatus sp.]MDN5771081.1 DUF2249 domain-containing protein [Microlunatus sp.]MDN5803417.1 DUF2249 domain-containing protein [Microlunatus sp.]
MNVVVVASSEADAQAAAAVEQHHAQLAGTLQIKVDAVFRAAGGGDQEEVRTAARDLAAWCRAELIPHAVAEEETLYAAAGSRPQGRLLVDGMRTEHAVLVGLVDDLAGPALSLIQTVASAGALQVMFANHLEKENTLVLPLLISDPEISVADLLAGMHDLIGGAEGHEHAAQQDDATAPHGEHSCACGETDGAEYPVLDARAVPHAIRHATIFGALDGVRSGAGLVLVAPHDPKPLLAQVEQRNPGLFSVEYLERGPDAWRLVFARQAG